MWSSAFMGREFLGGGMPHSGDRPGGCWGNTPQGCLSSLCSASPAHLGWSLVCALDCSGGNVASSSPLVWWLHPVGATALRSQAGPAGLLPSAQEPSEELVALHWLLLCLLWKLYSSVVRVLLLKLLELFPVSCLCDFEDIESEGMTCSRCWGDFGPGLLKLGEAQWCSQLSLFLHLFLSGCMSTSSA